MTPQAWGLEQEGQAKGDFRAGPLEVTRPRGGETEGQAAATGILLRGRRSAARSHRLSQNTRNLDF